MGGVKRESIEWIYRERGGVLRGGSDIERVCVFSGVYLA